VQIAILCEHHLLIMGMRIGLLVNTLIYAYQNDLVLGAHNECIRQGVDLYCMAGGGISMPMPQGTLYDCVSAQDFDGLVVSSGTMVHANSDVVLPSFLNQFASLPLTTIASTCEGHPAILVDNATGVTEMVVHLAQIHHRKKIAFLRVDSPEGNQRFQGYKKGLNDAQLPYSPELVIDSEFTFDSGLRAVRELREVRRVAYDAVVASSDWLAIGMMDGLRRRGLHVPDDVSVVGFDDIEEARFATPSLTTIRQPIRQLGMQAVRATMARIRGESGPQTIVVPTQTCIRQSCGCFSRPLKSDLPPTSESHLGIADLSRKRADLIEIIRESSPDIGIQDKPNWAEGLVNALLMDLQDTSQHRFLETLESWLEGAASVGSLIAWHNPIMRLRASCFPYLLQSGEAVMHAGWLFEQAHVLISRWAERAQGRRRMAKEHSFFMLNTVGAGLRESLELRSPSRALIRQLEWLEIPSMFIVFQGGERKPDELAHLLLAYDSMRGMHPSPFCSTFRAGELVPKSQGPFRRHTMMITPLLLGDAGKGFCAIEMGPEDTTVYDGLREQINTALQCSELLRQLGDLPLS
jgi:DNA-binding LacI/PurR family transcriptional regulator